MTDPIRDAAIEAAARLELERVAPGRVWEAQRHWAREAFGDAVTPLVDAVLAVVGPAYRAEALRDAANTDARGYYMNDEWERFLRDRADAEEGA